MGSFNGSLDMISLAWRRARTELVRDEDELSYVLEKLVKLEDMTVTDQSWKDVGESWQALLSLRSQVSVERGQAVIECICTDSKVLQAIGTVQQLVNIQGTVPNDVLTMLNRGPSTHIRGNAYKYRKMIDRELARVRRVKDIQNRVVGSVATFAAAALVAIGNILGRQYNELLDTNALTAGIVAGAIVATLLLSCLGAVSIRWWRERRSA